MTRPAIEGFGWWWHCQQLKAWRRCEGIVNKSRLFCFNHTGSCHDEGVDYGGSPEIPMTLSKHVTCVEDDDDLVKTILWNTSQRRWICSLCPGQESSRSWIMCKYKRWGHPWKRVKGRHQAVANINLGVAESCLMAPHCKFSVLIGTTSTRREVYQISQGLIRGNFKLLLPH